MKGEYQGREAGAREGGERVLLWATVVKTVDRSNHVVHCAGEIFRPSAQAMSDAEPTAAQLRQAATEMAMWERREAERLEAEEKAQTEGEGEAEARVPRPRRAGREGKVEAP